MKLIQSKSKNGGGKLLMAGPMMVPALATLWLTKMLSYKDQPEAKIGAFSLFCLCQGMGISPLLAMSSAQAIQGAFLSTGCTMASLAAVAYSAPSEEYLTWHTPLAMGCGAMVGVSVASLVFP